jgi:hypothetical protein
LKTKGVKNKMKDYESFFYINKTNNDVEKMFRSENYKYNFNLKNGNFIRWGKALEDDPEYSPFGGEIADIEISTKCNGINGKLCPMCYKSNTPDGQNMSYETFEKLFNKLNLDVLTQIAFGSGSTAEENPDIWKMFELCRSKMIIPNITVANISDETADKLFKYCGAVAVSRYADKNVCYDSVKKLTDRGLKQTNIHICVCKDTYNQVIETLNDYLTDERLKKLNAIVLLSLKQKGRGKNIQTINQEEFNQIVNFALENKIPIGFDSCTATKFLVSIKEHKDFKQFETLVEPCESTIFSQYFNVEGKFFPCSFCEGEEQWSEGLDVINCNNFIEDIWMNERVVSFRNKLLKNCRKCFMFKV